jgi:hypothetical protein
VLKLNKYFEPKYQGCNIFRDATFHNNCTALSNRQHTRCTNFCSQWPFSPQQRSCV